MRVAAMRARVGELFPNLPLPDDHFGFATVAFGVRNVADPVVALREMARVVRPGGRVVVLEFCKPRLPVFAQLYGFYFRQVLPRLGKWICGSKGDASPSSETAKRRPSHSARPPASPVPAAADGDADSRSRLRKVSL